jgi:hypothetical protein
LSIAARFADVSDFSYWKDHGGIQSLSSRARFADVSDFSYWKDRAAFNR